MNRFFVCLLLAFSQLGWADYSVYALSIKNEGQVPVTKFTIIAERASGSNYVEALMMFNTNLPSIPFFHKHFPPWYELPAEKYDGDPKHYSFEGTDDYLFIVVYRNPYDWVRSFHRQPHLASPDFYAIPFEYFIHKTWKLNSLDPLFADLHKCNPLIDCDPMEGVPFKNVMKLRTAKARTMLKIKKKAKNVYYLNYEIARDHPQEVLNEISRLYKIQINPTYAPIRHYKGHTALPLYEKSSYAPISSRELEYINGQLDEELERELGYKLDGYF